MRKNIIRNAEGRSQDAEVKITARATVKMTKEFW